MGRDEISERQLAVTLAVALLMLVSALLPTLTAQLAGSAGWLSALGAIPVLLCAGWVTKKVGLPLNGKYLRIIFGTIYMLWTLLLLALCLRLCAARLAEIGGETAGAICACAAALLAVWMGMGKLSAFARAVEIFYLALAVLLAGMLLLSLFQIEWSNFAADWVQLCKLPRSSAAAAGVVLNICPALVLLKRVAPRVKGEYGGVKGVISFCAVAALLLGAVTGCLGAQLTGKISSPFLIMVQGLGIQGAFQRGEALIAAMWSLSDLTLAGLLLHTWREYVTDLYHREKWGQRSVIPAAAAALAGGWILFGDVKVLWGFCSKALPVMGLLLGLVFPALLAAGRALKEIRTRG